MGACLIYGMVIALSGGVKRRMKSEFLNKEGLSALELAVVLALIAIMATFTIPYLGSWLKHYRVIGASRDLASACQEARLKAVSDNVEWRVVIDRDSDTYWLEQGNDLENSTTWVAQGTPKPLPKGVKFVTGSAGNDATGKLYLILRPSGKEGNNTDGSSTFNESDVQIYIKGETADIYQVEIRTLTARVAIYRWNGTGWEPA